MSISSGNGSVDGSSDIEDFAQLANKNNDDVSIISDGDESVDEQRRSTHRASFETTRTSSKTRQSSPEEINTKRDYLVKLHDLKARGVSLTGSYNMDTDANDLILEYTRHAKSLKKKNSLAFSKRALLLAVQGMEMMSNVNPLGIHVDLDGWSDAVNPDEYDDILEELIEKYSGDSTTPPELRLVFALATSAISIHVSNSMFGSKAKKGNFKPVMRKRGASTSSSDSDESNTDVKEPDFTNVMKMLNSKPKVKAPKAAKVTIASPPETADEEDSSDEEIILPNKINNKVVYSSSDEDSDSGESSSDDDDDKDQITMDTMKATSIGTPAPVKPRRGRPPGTRGRGRGRPTQKNVMTIN